MMLTPSDLKSRYLQAVTKPPLPKDEESVCVLFQNDWVRILTVHDSETSHKWRIEVEVSLPSKSDPESGRDVKVFVQNLIRHLEYLLRLDSEGLDLGILTRDGLWTASLEIDDLPPNSLFKVLVPPSL